MCPNPGEALTLTLPSHIIMASTGVLFDDLAFNIESVLNSKGPALICLKIVPEIENTAVHFQQRTGRNMQMAIADLSKLFGR